MKKIVCFICLMTINFSAALALGADRVVVIPLGSSSPTSKGNATKADVLNGKTFSNSTAIGLTGTRPPAPVPKVSSSSNGHGVPWPSPRFTGGLIPGFKDGLTGLSWTQSPYNVSIDWLTAVEWCEDLDTGGGLVTVNDWRLPTIKELESLVDYSQIRPVLPDENPFINVSVSELYWSSSAIEIQSLWYAWTMNFDNGEVHISPLITAWEVWCVRGGN